MSTPNVEARLERSRQERARFVQRIRKMEGIARDDPKAYRMRVRAMAFLGYGYIFGVLLVVLAVLAALVAAVLLSGRLNTGEIKLFLIVGVVALGILRSLWVKIDPPEGLVVTREEAPELYRTVEAIADDLKAPRPDEIRLDSALNAAAIQVPRLGIFGWYRNVLLLGLPLLATLSPDEARGVIAHEFGHFSGAHGQFAVWIYRLNRTWEQLHQNLQGSQGRGSWIFTGFFNWFQPRFAATSFVLRRADEYEADRAAARVAGPHTIARALMRMPFLTKHLESAFWNPLLETAKQQPSPAAGFLGPLIAAGQADTDPITVRRRLRIALEVPTDYDDTHPSLSDRLAALGQTPSADLDALAADLGSPIRTSAAQAFFGDRLETVTARLEADMMPSVQKRWAEAHEKHQKETKELTRLEGLAEEEPLTEGQSVDRAYLTARVRGPEAAEPLYRALIAQHPENAALHYLLGEYLLERGLEEGVPLMQRAAELDPEMVLPAKRELASYYYERGEHDQVTTLREETMDVVERHGIAQEAAARITVKDDLDTHGLPSEQVQALAAMVAKVPHAERAYFVRKRLPGTNETIHYLVVIRRKRLFDARDENRKFLNAVLKAVKFPIRSRVWVTEAGGPWRKRMDKVPGAMIWSRTGK